jgi:hypothetical protein
MKKNENNIHGQQILTLLKDSRFINNKYELIWPTITKEYGNLFKRVHGKVKKLVDKEMQESQLDRAVSMFNAFLHVV